MPGRHRPHLGAEQVHAPHVGRLALDVGGAHVHDAVHAEQRARGRGRHAVLPGARLGHDAGLAHAARQQRLAEGVVDLVRAGVGQVLALQEHADVVPRTVRQRLRRYLEQRRRTADEVTLQAGQLVAVRGVAPGCRPRGGQLVERRDQRLGNESAAIRAEPPAAVHPVGTGRLASRRPHEGEDAPGIRRARRARARRRHRPRPDARHAPLRRHSTARGRRPGQPEGSG